MSMKGNMGRLLVKFKWLVLNAVYILKCSCDSNCLP